jgi:hypothetical protein
VPFCLVLKLLLADHSEWHHTIPPPEGAARGNRAHRVDIPGEFFQCSFQLSLEKSRWNSDSISH